MEEEVLWAVLTNAVEVQVSEGSALGIGVYGPWFSWFNHSCSPNACYRFEVGSSRMDSCGSGSYRVSPASDGEETDLVSLIIHVENFIMDAHHEIDHAC